MISYIVKPTLLAVPVLIGVSMINFTILCHAPNDPTAHLPMTLPADVRETMRANLGLDQPCHIRYFSWARQMFFVEPAHALGFTGGAKTHAQDI